MREQLAEAAILIGVGMGVVFAALVILMIAITIINRLAPEKVKKARGPVSLEAILCYDSQRERIAALAVALAEAMHRDGESLMEPSPTRSLAWAAEPSRWVVSGREQAMLLRGKAGRQWGRRSD